MRVRAGSRWAAGAVAAVVVAGCGATVPSDVPSRADGEVWVVGIGDPRGGWSECFDDDAVAESLMTADLPTSGASATFRAAASEEDVRRVLDCLDRALTEGTVSVTTRAP